MSRAVALIVGGLSTAVAGVTALLFAKKTTSDVKGAVSGYLPWNPLVNDITVHLTGYWPFQSGLSAAERKMEGAPVDRKGKPLVTVEQHLSSPDRFPFVSLSGDPDIFPYGQKLTIPWGVSTIVGRVVDTGSHFHGLGKVFRVVGAEPIDVCVDSSSTVIPHKTVKARVIVGDHLDKASKEVAFAKVGKPTVVSGLDGFGVEG